MLRNRVEQYGANAMCWEKPVSSPPLLPQLFPPPLTVDVMKHPPSRHSPLCCLPNIIYRTQSSLLIGQTPSAILCSQAESQNQIFQSVALKNEVNPDGPGPGPLASPSAGLTHTIDRQDSNSSGHAICYTEGSLLNRAKPRSDRHTHRQDNVCSLLN